MYDHSKMTGAIAACIYLYLTEQNRTDFHDGLYKNEKAFLDEKAFLMFSCDMSGIQSFIYTTSGEGALKALRARSLYLEILLEQIADEILQAVGLSRANLIYTGGGHAYLLLPNTQAVQDTLTDLSKDINQWFIRNFDNDLYLAMAWQPCSGNDLMNKGAEKDAYQQIITLRRSDKTFIYGDFEVLNKKKNRFVYRRYEGQKEYVIDCNLGKETCKAHVMDSDYELVYSTKGDTAELSSYEARIWKKK